MIAHLLSPELLIFALVCYAHAEARRDFDDIEGGKDIDHRSGLIRRVFIAGVACAIVFGLAMPHTWASAIACAQMACGIWAPVFRWRLNHLRGLDPDYISYSNVYDSLFLLVSPGHGGRLAYAVEITAVAYGIFLYYSNLNP